MEGAAQHILAARARCNQLPRRAEVQHDMFLFILFVGARELSKLSSEEHTCFVFCNFFYQQENMATSVHLFLQKERSNSSGKTHSPN